MERAGLYQGALPDPFAPVLPPLPIEQQRNRRRPPPARGQRARRAAILATTRRMLAESGLDAFTVRGVAESCEVTVQTIHNSFGRRQDLLVAALNEHTSEIERAAALLSPGPMLFLHLARLYSACAAQSPTFLREMVSTAFSPMNPLMAMQNHGARNKTRLLQMMTIGGQLRDDVKAEALAQQITRLNTLTVFEWSRHGDVAEMHREIMFGNRLLLQGALRTAAADQVEAWFAEQGREPLPLPIL